MSVIFGQFFLSPNNSWPFPKSLFLAALFDECVDKIDKGEAEGDECAKTNRYVVTNN